MDEVHLSEFKGWLELINWLSRLFLVHIVKVSWGGEDRDGWTLDSLQYIVHGEEGHISGVWAQGVQRKDDKRALMTNKILLFHSWAICKLTDDHKMLSVSKISMEVSRRVEHPNAISHGLEVYPDCCEPRSETERPIRLFIVLGPEIGI